MQIREKNRVRPFHVTIREVFLVLRELLADYLSHDRLGQIIMNFESFARDET